MGSGSCSSSCGSAAGYLEEAFINDGYAIGSIAAAEAIVVYAAGYFEEAFCNDG